MSINHVVLGTGAIGRAVMEELVRRGESGAHHARADARGDEGNGGLV